MKRVSPPYFSTTAGAAGPNTGQFCGHCGDPSDGGPSTASDIHLRCRERLAMEPPRYCAACRRRMKVQVTPLGWSAECSRHGVLAP
ncbi:biotin synthase auxiliary protein BsaP [Arthrobacter sp. B6]|uniref:biotin synthase auxiliary protein BsaP n=1 Tax=Arthrobacter sp. B6 TaxID=1570137 RepID=UPI0009EED027